MLKIEEVAVLCGVSVQTINNWYKFKRENPDNEYAKLLPRYEVMGSHNQRLWDKADINDLLRFKQFRPNGCKGIMGSVTQKYVRKEES
jgi:DNA-binding transcriptional MerR regulator